jgi:molybdopterin synthase sulfur carrier subunit
MALLNAPAAWQSTRKKRILKNRRSRTDDDGRLSMCIRAHSYAIFIVLPGGLLMSVTVRIPSPLQQYTEQQSEVELEGKTVREVLVSFKARFPDASTRFFSANTSRYMNLYLNDQDIRSLNDLDTPVGEKDILSIVFAIAGG